MLNNLNDIANQGNQYIVVAGLTKSARDQLEGDEPHLGDIGYRMTLEVLSESSRWLLCGHINALSVTFRARWRD